MGLIERFRLILINPAKAFWDIVHKPSGKGGGIIFLWNILIYGLVGVALTGKLNFTYSPSLALVALIGFANYLIFMVYGVIYFGMMWMFIIFAHTIGARFMLNVSPKMGKQTGVMYWAFFPSIFSTAIYVLIIAIGIVPVDIPSPSYNLATQLPNFLWNNRVTFMVADIFQIAFYFGYLSILLTFAYRELYNASTLKAFISTVITGIACAVIFIYTRSTFPIGVL
ncbi:MAG: hypothetical protein ACTSVI_10290 [Promethearchaeota archaeon]